MLVTQTEPQRIVLLCRCSRYCGKPWGYVENGELVVVSRHGYERHTNRIPLAELVAMQQQSSCATMPDGGSDYVT